MPILKAERLTALKAKVKKEMLRRNKSGSVAAYGGAEYDYTVEPGPGKVLLQEHLDKLSVPLSAINSNAVPGKTGERVVTEAELAAMETKVTAWAARTITDTSGTDCKSGCTGACYTGCSGACKGCGSGCPTGCSGCNGCTGCGSGCPNGCSGCGSGCPDGCSSCGGACSNNCDGCSGCGDNCSSGCGKACSWDCNATCSLECKGCTDSCSGCGRACSWDCNATCSLECKGCGSGCPNTCQNFCTNSDYT